MPREANWYAGSDEGAALWPVGAGCEDDAATPAGGRQGWLASASWASDECRRPCALSLPAADVDNLRDVTYLSGLSLEIQVIPCACSAIARGKGRKILESKPISEMSQYT